jgi:hypothetical protein
VPILDAPLNNEHIKDDADDPERCEYLVPVRWEWTAPAGQGFWRTRFFSRRTTATPSHPARSAPTRAFRMCGKDDHPRLDGSSVPGMVSAGASGGCWRCLGGIAEDGCG